METKSVVACVRCNLTLLQPDPKYSDSGVCGLLSACYSMVCLLDNLLNSSLAPLHKPQLV
jgi:hypothetical protein